MQQGEYTAKKQDFNSFE